MGIQEREYPNSGGVVKVLPVRLLATPLSLTPSPVVASPSVPSDVGTVAPTVHIVSNTTQSIEPSVVPSILPSSIVTDDKSNTFTNIAPSNISDTTTSSISNGTESGLPEISSDVLEDDSIDPTVDIEESIQKEMMSAEVEEVEDLPETTSDPEYDSINPTVDIEESIQKNMTSAQVDEIEDLPEPTLEPSVGVKVSDPSPETKDTLELSDEESLSYPFLDEEGRRKILVRRGTHKKSRRSRRSKGYISSPSRHKEEKVPNYPFALNYKMQSEYDLVLCTSVEAKGVRQSIEL